MERSQIFNAPLQLVAHLITLQSIALIYRFNFVVLVVHAAILSLVKALMQRWQLRAALLYKYHPITALTLIQVSLHLWLLLISLLTVNKCTFTLRLPQGILPDSSESYSCWVFCSSHVVYLVDVATDVGVLPLVQLLHETVESGIKMGQFEHFFAVRILELEGHLTDLVMHQLTVLSKG